MALEKGDDVMCEQCDTTYMRVGQHWSGSNSCGFPPLTSLQKDILIGSLMGDGVVGNKHRKNQRMKVQWSSKEQCEWLDDILGWLSTGVNLARTAEEAAEAKTMNRFNSDPDNYSDQYYVRTRSHPFISELTDWYGESGYEDKCWPEDLHLTSTVLLLWFVGDGHYRNDERHSHIKISLSKEIENEQKVASYFSSVDLPTPTNWAISTRSDGSEKCEAVWSLRESETIFEYMSESPLMSDGVPDGFEYKFPVGYSADCEKIMEVPV